MTSRLKAQVPAILRVAAGLTLLFAIAVVGVVLLQRGTAHSDFTRDTHGGDCLSCHDDLPQQENYIDLALLTSSPHGMFGSTLPVYWYTETGDQPLQGALQASDVHRPVLEFLHSTFHDGEEGSQNSVETLVGSIEEPAVAVPQETQATNTD